MSEKFEIRFSVQAEPGSPEFELLSYLKNPDRTLYPLKDMAMVALTSVWLPLVYRDNQQVSPRQLHQIICDCTQRLMMQLQYFREMDGLAALERERIEKYNPVGQLDKQILQSPPIVDSEAQYDPDDLFNN